MVVPNIMKGSGHKVAEISVCKASGCDLKR